ncbi:MAG: hypothetical protein DME24_07455 [Verrucomicrobia bacterium]|nr:MAG: hypothetical protein DME24_07455 [Verrucomicrobiota bacterium]
MLMQIAGEQCRICNQGVTFETDGILCARCKVIFHRSRLGGPGAVCPSCKQIARKLKTFR